MQKQIKIQCPAKINLTLKILNKRADGFHEIDSIMQTINLFDYLNIEVEKSSKNEIFLSVFFTSILSIYLTSNKNQSETGLIFIISPFFIISYICRSNVMILRFFCFKLLTKCSYSLTIYYDFFLNFEGVVFVTPLKTFLK